MGIEVAEVVIGCVRPTIFDFDDYPFNRFSYIRGPPDGQGPLGGGEKRPRDLGEDSSFRHSTGKETFVVFWDEEGGPRGGPP